MGSTMLDYHRASKMGRSGGGAVLRWSAHPGLLERPGTDDAITLPRTGLSPDRGTFAALEGAAEGATPPPRSGGVLGTILAYGYGLVGAQRFPAGAIPRRPAPSAGGLYPCTLAVATTGAGDVPAGVYAYAPVEHSLVPVRPGGAAATAVRDAAGAGGTELDPVLLMVASYWRSAWKYQLRALRYCALDAGHGAGAILASAAGVDAEARVLKISEPTVLDEILGLDPSEAGVMGAIGLGLLGAPRASSGGPPAELVRPAVEGQPIDGVMADAASAATHAVREATHAGDKTRPTTPPPLPEGVTSALPVVETIEGGMPLADAVLRRHSTRRYRRQGLELDQLARLLGAASSDASGNLSFSVAVRAVEGLDSGIFRFVPEEKDLVALRPGRVAEELASAALGQKFVGQAAVCAMPVADLAATIERGGPRAYIDAFFDAGVGGQRLYLAATALGLGCCAVGAYDDEEVNMLACLEGKNESVLCLFTLGLPRED